MPDCHRTPTNFPPLPPMTRPELERAITGCFVGFIEPAFCDCFDPSEIQNPHLRACVEALSTPTNPSEPSRLTPELTGLVTWCLRFAEVRRYHDYVDALRRLPC